MLKVHYIPSWNGDLRLEPDPADPEKATTLAIVKPTASERQQLRTMLAAFSKRGWLEEVGDDLQRLAERSGKLWTKRVRIHAPLSEVGPVVIPIAKPGRNVLTAIRFRDGRVEIVEAAELEAATAEPKPVDAKVDEGKTADAKAVDKSEGKPADAKVEDKPVDKLKELAAKPDAAAAATVRRPTPCCPDCYVDAIKPATEALLAFLDEEQHRTWASERYVIARGQYTRHRYLIAHRNSPIAACNGRMAYDLDDNLVMHFHDWTVPPEEEVLATMLILQHREPWLRNEATALGGGRHVFKNPFGDGGDGVSDSALTRRIGYAMLDALGLVPQRSRGRRGHRLFQGGVMYDTTVFSQPTYAIGSEYGVSSELFCDSDYSY